MVEDVDRELVIEGDQEAIQAVEAALRETGGGSVVTAQVQKQTGDPNLWMLAGKIIITSLAVVGPILLEMIKQRRIGYLKWGDLELRDVTVETARPVLEAVTAGKRADQA